MGSRCASGPVLEQLELPSNILNYLNLFLLLLGRRTARHENLLYLLIFHVFVYRPPPPKRQKEQVNPNSTHVNQKTDMSSQLYMSLCIYVYTTLFMFHKALHL